MLKHFHLPITPFRVEMMRALSTTAKALTDNEIKALLQLKCDRDYLLPNHKSHLREKSIYTGPGHIVYFLDAGIKNYVCQNTDMKTFLQISL
jgi:hypothetical protein